MNLSTDQNMHASTNCFHCTYTNTSVHTTSPHKEETVAAVGTTLTKTHTNSFSLSLSLSHSVILTSFCLYPFLYLPTLALYLYHSLSTTNTHSLFNSPNFSFFSKRFPFLLSLSRPNSLSFASTLSLSLPCLCWYA
jgi:hypothetical protein